MRVEDLMFLWISKKAVENGGGEYLSKVKNSSTYVSLSFPRQREKKDGVDLKKAKARGRRRCVFYCIGGVFLEFGR